MTIIEAESYDTWYGGKGQDSQQEETKEYRNGKENAEVKTRYRAEKLLEQQ